MYGPVFSEVSFDRELEREIVSHQSGNRNHLLEKLRKLYNNERLDSTQD